MVMRKAGLLALASGGMLAAVALSARRSGSEARVSLHPMDLPPHQDPNGRRTWKSTGHLAHHLAELALLSRPLASTYLLRAIDPAFRERVMLVTALANECSW